jgi:hypothetical protein
MTIGALTMNKRFAETSIAGTALVLFLSGCHSSGSDPLGPQVARTPESAAGCYRMVIGDWTPPGGRIGLTPPTEFRLDTALATDGRGAGFRRRTVVARAPAGQTRYASWRLDTGDTLHVAWSTGFVMGGYVLVARGDSVFGRATTATDVRAWYPDPIAPARGAHVACG